MKKISLLFLLLATASIQAIASPLNKLTILIAPGSLSENTVTILWSKLESNNIHLYNISINGRKFSSTTKTNFTFNNLSPNTWYTIKIVEKKSSYNNQAITGTIKFKTTARGKIYNILDFGAKNDSSFSNTHAIQAAIDACTEGGTVYIPKGIFVSGALFLKSNMTLYIEQGATLKGSTEIADYEPMILNRFEGWEMETYASLINAGRLNHNGVYNIRNLRITGGGTISGGGGKLGDAMIKAKGLRSRGRLICLMNCQDVCISNLTITEPPSWTIHYIYSNNITCHDLNINTFHIRNGDGIDPDSSTDAYIFNCTFDTGDDCIAIKSGKNPEGYYIAKPTQHVYITDCDFKRGHGISIGSEMSGGVSDVVVKDCKAGNLLHGFQIKGTKERGGYVKNITVINCQLLQITVFSAVNYNNDGKAAPEAPVFSNFTFKRLDLSKANTNNPVIDINGFSVPLHQLKNVIFENIVLPENAKVKLTEAQAVTFKNVTTVSGLKPGYIINNCSDIIN
ncbi:MAG: glycoside hydrolase family 28 protein [Bacteroidota bacterium]|nr:glycoside hydrolase family 28 protein [Bacteroidota bacterium]